MNRIQETIDEAENHCRQMGSNLTVKRKHVLSGLLASEKAMSAYELAAYCKEHFDEALPPMSVYRILDFLKEAHLVHKLNLANKYVACSHILCGHEHGVPQFLICDQCQKVQEIRINSALLDDLRKNVAEAGYRLQSEQLELSCRCQECAGAADA